jgi:hypothetical protein
MFAPVAIPGRGADPSSADVRDEIRNWIDSDAMTALLGEFSGPAARDGSLADRLAELEGFSARVWDFRANRERNLIDPNAIEADAQRLTLDAAQALGLVAPEQPRSLSYDHILVLGGLVRACVLRSEYTALLMKSGLKARSVAALTGFRVLAGDEPELLHSFGLPPTRSEHEVMTNAVVEAFQVGCLDVTRQSDMDVPDNERFLVAEGTTQDGTALRVVVAPSEEPRSRRANTADTYRYWAREMGRPGRGDSLLLVTSTIYVPFQHADAIRILGLPLGCRLDTIGFDPQRVDDRRVPQSFTAAHYLQEIRSAIRSLRLLEAELPT